MPVGDVAVRQGGRCHQRSVGDAHLVVRLVALAQAAQNRDGVFDGRLADEHLLEAPLQRGILLDPFAVLVQGGGADHAQFAAGQHRLEHVAGIHRRVAGRPGSHHRVQLVDEGDDLTLGVADLVEHRLQPLFELAAVLGSGHHRGQVEADHAASLQRVGHVTGHHPLGEPFDHGGLAHAGLADQHRVVLGAPGQHLHHAADLGIAADHRVELAVAGLGGEVDGVLVEGRFAALLLGRGDALVAAGVVERRDQLLRIGAELQQDLLRVADDGGQADHQVLGGDELVAHLFGAGLGVGQHPGQAARHGGLADRVARRAGQLGDRALGRRVDHLGVGTDRAEQAGDGVVGHHQQRVQQVHRLGVGVAVGKCVAEGRRHCVAALRGELGSVHVVSFS